MSSPDLAIMKSRHVLQLSSLEDHLNLLCEEAWLNTNSNSGPLNTLLASVRIDPSSPIVTVEFSFIPVSTEIVERSDVLQIIANLLVDASVQPRNYTEKLLSAINTKTPIGSFYLDRAFRVVFRYGCLVPSDIIKYEDFKDIFKLYIHTYRTFNSMVKAVLTGQMSLATALEQLW